MACLFCFDMMVVLKQESLLFLVALHPATGFLQYELDVEEISAEERNAEHA